MILHLSQDDKLSSCGLWMFQISTMANFETVSLWAFEAFWLVQAIMTERSAIVLRLPSWSKLTNWAFLTARPPVSWFLGKYHSEIKCFFVRYWNRNVYCCWIVRKRRESQAARDLATVLPDTCRPYVLQMRRNESKYANNCHNQACFPRIHLSILHR